MTPSSVLAAFPAASSLALCASLLAAPALTGCAGSPGDVPDASDEATGSSEGSSDGSGASGASFGSAGSTGGGASSGVTDASSDSFGGEESGGIATSAGSTSGGSTGGSTGGQHPAPPCAVAPPPGPLWGGGVPAGLLTQNPYGMTGTGLADVEELLAPMPDGVAAADVQVAGAMVLAVGQELPPGGTNRFWVAERDAAVVVKLASAARVFVRPGDEVSFRVTEISRVGGEPQISEILDFQVTSDSNDVEVSELQTPVSFAAHGHRLILAHGLIEGDLYPCGAYYQCQDFTYYVGNTALDGQIRQDPTLTLYGMTDGDCVELQVPVGTFLGNDMFDLQNPEWWRGYRD